ncbi:MAG: hypothetical protein N2169_05555, partial [bacterium]|nr:hypothetical protein [bacterium]
MMTSLQNRDRQIVFYPSHWLYNAGVIGFLKILEKCNIEIEKLFDKNSGVFIIHEQQIRDILDNKIDSLKGINGCGKWHLIYLKETLLLYQKSDKDNEIYRFLKQELLNKINKKASGSGGAHKICGVDIKKEFSELDSKNKKNKLESQIDRFLEDYFDCLVCWSSLKRLFSKGGFYQNLFNPAYSGDPKKFVSYWSSSRVFEKENNTAFCDFCLQNNYKLDYINSKFFSLLFPSHRKFPNSFWNLSEKGVIKICSLCNFIIMHFHFAIMNIKNLHNIFVNTPNFFLTYKLNSILEHDPFNLFGSNNENSNHRIISPQFLYNAIKFKSLLGYWSLSNIEVIKLKKKDNKKIFIKVYGDLELPSNRIIIK